MRKEGMDNILDNLIFKQVQLLPLDAKAKHAPHSGD